MATITSNRNDNSNVHVTVNPALGSTWAGGVVPTGVDQVFISGRRTTINQSAFVKWAGTRTITVASTTNFASSGFFYTATDQGEVVKVNYTGTTATTFTGCSVDETDPFYTWTGSTTTSSIFNGAYVHNPAYIVKIESGNVFECNELIIQEGGWLLIEGGNLKVNQGILVRDGRLIGRGNGNIIISRSAGTAASSTVGYLNAENFQMSIIDIDGGEVRTYANLTANVSVGNCFFTTTEPINGTFAVGDEIAVYEYDDYRRRNKGYTGYRDATCNFKDMDEGFDVCGVKGNDIYVAKRHGARGNILSVVTEGNNKIIEINPDSIYFVAGDKIVINSNVYTITSIEDSEVTLYNYDFTNPNTALTDFWVNDPFHVYSGGWNIQSGVGIRNSGGYRELVHKYFWSRESIVEAEMSPLDGYSSGSRGTSAFGLLSAYDPIFRFGHRGYDSTKSDYFIIDDASSDVYFAMRAMSNANNNVPGRDTPLLNTIRGPATYKVVNRRAMSTVYINGEEFDSYYRRDGHFKGLVGIYTNGNNSFRCKRLTIKVPTQKVILNTTNAINPGDIAYQSGIDHSHIAGSKVLKIASKNTGTGNHHDLAFGYTGQDGSGIFPHAFQINAANTTNQTLPLLTNHDANEEYFLNLGETTSNVSVTIDLTYPVDFTHVSFQPRMIESSGFYGFNSVCVLGSNNLSTWTILYGPTNDTKKWYGGGGSFGRLAFYPTGNVNYRFMRFQTAGDQGGSNRNRYVNVGVHDFREGYALGLNNASDFNVGDVVTVFSDSGYGRVNREFEAYQAWVIANASNPEEYMQGGWQVECRITGKQGNTIYLDKPVWWGYVEGKDSVTVVKLNRNFVITGTMGPTSAFSDWRWPNISLNSGTTTPRKYLFRNARFNYIGSARHSGSGNFNRGVISNSQEYWNHPMFDGIVHNMGPDGTSWQGVGTGSSGLAIFRNSISIGQYWSYYFYYQPSLSGGAVFNCKTINSWRGLYNEGMEVFAINYNEFINNDQGAIINSLRRDAMASPAISEFKHNIIKGTTNYAISMNDTSPVKRTARINLDYNKSRGMDDNTAGTNTEGSPFKNSNFLSDHTGSRVSRYANAGGLVSVGDIPNDLAFLSFQENFGRFGYDIAVNNTGHVERNYNRPGELRFHRFTNDTYLPFIGIEIDVLDNVAFQIYVKFDYKIPWAGHIQDDYNLDGQAIVYGVQKGTLIPGSPKLGTLPTSMGKTWQTFEGLFDTFSAEQGRAGVFFARATLNYTDVRNATAYVLTDHPGKILVVMNSFRIDKIFDQVNENKDTRPLTTSNARTLNIRKFKF